MSVRMRHTRAHTNNRRSHHALSATKTVKDKESGKLRLPHRLDESTGMYRGKQLFTPKVKQPKQAHTHGTHHEHVREEIADEQKPEEAKAVEQTSKGKRGHAKEGPGPDGK